MRSSPTSHKQKYCQPQHPRHAMQQKQRRALRKVPHCNEQGKRCRICRQNYLLLQRRTIFRDARYAHTCTHARSYAHALRLWCTRSHTVLCRPWHFIWCALFHFLYVDSKYIENIDIKRIQGIFKIEMKAFYLYKFAMHINQMKECVSNAMNSFLSFSIPCILFILMFSIQLISV